MHAIPLYSTLHFTDDDDNDDDDDDDDDDNDGEGEGVKSSRNKLELRRPLSSNTKYQGGCLLGEQGNVRYAPAGMADTLVTCLSSLRGVGEHPTLPCFALVGWMMCLHVCRWRPH